MKSSVDVSAKCVSAGNKRVIIDRLYNDRSRSPESAPKLSNEVLQKLSRNQTIAGLVNFLGFVSDWKSKDKVSFVHFTCCRLFIRFVQ